MLASGQREVGNFGVRRFVATFHALFPRASIDLVVEVCSSIFDRLPNVFV